MTNVSSETKSVSQTYISGFDRISLFDLIEIPFVRGLLEALKLNEVKIQNMGIKISELNNKLKQQ